ncbi:MAG: M1 family aminopeptidase [Flavobacteriales bacterium]
MPRFRIVQLLVLFLIFNTKSVAQDTQLSCRELKGRTQVNGIKSASLSVAEIAQTELYDVSYYFLDLHMTNTSTYLQGKVAIHATALVQLDTALIELFETLNISQVKVNGSVVSYNRISNRVKIPVNAGANQTFIMEIQYAGNPPTAQTNPLGGSGLTAGTSNTWSNKVVWSLSEPFSAYEWFAVKQSLTDKADSCAVHITVPDTLMAGSNGVLENVVTLPNGYKRFEWKHRHPIDYYLISVSVAKYIDYSIYANPVGANAPVLIQNFIYDNPNTLPYFIDEINETVDFIELYAQLYGPYPFADEKYGHCMAPIGGGMEHQTMTTQGLFEKTLTAHELAHQWWGNNVTCASWCDIWLNEGFASYSEYLMLANLYPGQQVNQMQQVHQSVMNQAGGSVWVLDSLNEARIFNGRLTYDKGAAIIHSIRYLINNDSLFFDGMRAFQQFYANGTATGIDFKNFMTNFCAVNLDAFFEQWYFGEGFPTYDVVWNQVSTDLHLQINQVVSMPNITPVFTNPVDLRISRQAQPDTLIRFDIQANNAQFIITNLGIVQGGIYIDPSNWIINGFGGVDFNPDFTAQTQVINTANDWLIYPNPALNAFSVKNNEEGNLNFELYQSNGKLLKTGQIIANQWVDIHELSQGTYIIRLTNDNERQRSLLFNVE